MLSQGLYYLKKKRIRQVFQVSMVGFTLLRMERISLTVVVCHPDFPSNRVSEIFDVLGQLFKRIPIRFTNDEDWRLARVLYEPILQGKIRSGTSSFLDENC